MTSDEMYQTEWEYTLSDKAELYDWLVNNMGWDEIPEWAKRRVKEPQEKDYSNWRDVEINVKEGGF